VENIAAELSRKRTWLASVIQSKGYTVLQNNAPVESTISILSFFKPGAEMPALHQKLLDARIFTSLRTDRTAQKYIRLSPHYYNTEAELQRTLEILCVNNDAILLRLTLY